MYKDGSLATGARAATDGVGILPDWVREPFQAVANIELRVIKHLLCYLQNYIS